MCGNSVDEVPPAKLDRVDPELGRERVHRPLEDVRRLRPPGAAVGVGRRRVREDAGERDAVVRDLVRARVEPRAEQRDPGRDELEVGAHRARHLALDRRDLARRFVARERQLGDDVAAVDRGLVVLGPLLDPLHRAGRAAWRARRRGTPRRRRSSFEPKPPPTSGAMTRTLASGIPRTSGIVKRRMCRITVADQSVISSDAAPPARAGAAQSRLESAAAGSSAA